MALLSGPICLAADQQPAPESASARSAGHWVEHKYRFHAMTFTSTYSCNGLMDKLRRVLRTSGARVQNLMPLCSNGYGRPDRLAQVDIQFSTLQPGAESSTEGAAAAGSAGTWKRVQLAPQHPYDLQSGDCELIDQFRSALLPMFAVRDIKNNLRCIPNQDSGPFSLTFEVFAPAP
jgi:hypothetical protein